MHFFNELFPALTREIVVSLITATNKEIELKLTTSSSSTASSFNAQQSNRMLLFLNQISGKVLSILKNIVLRLLTI